MSDIQYFNYKQTLPLESGKTLFGFQLAYRTFGTLNEEKSNAIWIIHALTGDSDPTVWWSDIVGKGKVIDTEKYFVICANTLGSHYGSTSPLSMNPNTGKPYYHDFPQISNRDIVNAFDLLRVQLDIQKIHTVVGASFGGQQALEWLISRPYIFEKSILIATNAYHSPWGIAFNESQRMAIELDPTWRLSDDEAGMNGMAVARSLALLSYRSAESYNITQAETNESTQEYRAASYQRYQGAKIQKRFNAFSYHLLSKVMDSHNVARNRGSVQAALSRIKAQTTIIGIDSDVLFSLTEQHELADGIAHAAFHEIRSLYGHDGFLIEADLIAQIIAQSLEDKKLTQAEKAACAKSCC